MSAPGQDSARVVVDAGFQPHIPADPDVVPVVITYLATVAVEDMEAYVVEGAERGQSAYTEVIGPVLINTQAAEQILVLLANALGELNLDAARVTLQAAAGAAPPAPLLLPPSGIIVPGRNRLP